MSDALLKRLQEQRGRAIAASREILERYADGEEMSAEDETSYRKADEDAERLGKRILAVAKDEAEARDIDEAVAKATRKVDLAEQPEPERVSIAARMREDLAASRKGETRTGGLYTAMPARRMAAEVERRTAGLLDSVTTNQGPEVVPTTLARSLYEKLFDESTVLGLGPTVLRTESGEKIKLPRLTDPGRLAIANARVAQAGPIIKTANATFDQVELDAHKYGQIMEVSRELIEDGVLDIEGLMGELLGQNIAYYLGTDFTSGAGTTGIPKGVRIVVPVANKLDTAAGGLWGSLTDFDNFFTIIGKLKAGHRRNAKWVVNDAQTFVLRKLKMGSVYAWEPNLQGAGMPDRFLGYPIYTDPLFPVPASGAGITMLFADFSKYYVRLVRDIRVEWSMEYAWDTDLIAVKAVVRADADAIDDTAFAGYNSVA